MPRSRSKLMRTIPESPPATPPQESRGTHLLADPDARAPRRSPAGRLNADIMANGQPPKWAGPNLKNPNEILISGEGVPGPLPDSAIGGVFQAPDDDYSAPVIVVTPTPGAKPTFFDLGVPGKGKEFTKPYWGRFIRVEGVALSDFDQGQPMAVLKTLPGFHEQVNKLGIFDFKPSKSNKAENTLYIFCDTLSLTQEMLIFLKEHYNAAYSSRAGFDKAEVDIPSHVTRFTGTATVIAKIKPTSSHHNFSVDQVSDMVKSVVARFGPIEEFEVVHTACDAIKYSIEFDSVNDANDAILNTRPGVDMIFGRHEHLYVTTNNDEYAPEEPEPVTPGRPKDTTTDTIDPLTYSPTGRTAWVDTPSGRILTFSGYVSTPETHRSLYKHNRRTSREARNEHDYIYQAADELKGKEAYVDNYQTGGQDIISHKPQDVVLWRIENGTDVRTTLMIRNVPPEFTADDLYGVLNVCAKGQFDFAYNRIDFRQNQAVGYAFVNFTTTQALVSFVKKWRGQLLPRNVFRKHQKPCDVSYANIQGFECLVAKFRNSSILDEAANCRPKLFYTEETAPSEDLIGKEREFPGVDNQAKKNRSLQNAHVAGLYTPRNRGNGNGRGRGRRGFSQFDRGTSAQQYDERQMNMNYQYGGPAPMQSPGHFTQPRFHPGMQYGPQYGPQYGAQYSPQYGAQYSPQHGHQYTPQYNPQYGNGMLPQTPTAGPGSMLRTHTKGQLGPHSQVMPAYMAPVWNPEEAYLHHQGDFEPLLTPIKGQPPRIFRRVNFEGAQPGQPS